MKLFSELQVKEEVELFCPTCNKITQMSYLSAANHEMQFRCKKCKRPMNIKMKEAVQKETEVEGEYALDKTYKIGQRLYHKVFKEKGDVLGKNENSIQIRFEKIGLKKLVINYNG
jgi:hypothetical protein